MKTITGFVFALMLLGLFAACDRPPKSGKGFVFPEGDAARGKTAFVELKCYTCHRVDGADSTIPPPEVETELVILLGGETSRMRTYGDLVTSVIHPSYAISERVTGPRKWEMKESPMPAVNDQMTVMQLLDIVTFLQPRYRQLEPIFQNQPYGP
jgi:L-cysteine S-thiosulfotransferase